MTQLMLTPEEDRNPKPWLNFALLAALNLFAVASHAEMNITFYNLSFTTSLQHIFAKTVDQALAATTDEFGPYTLTFSTLPADTESLCQGTESGDIDIFFSAHFPAALADCKCVRLDIDLLNRALGIRLITVHKDNLEDFASIQTLNDLRSFTVGIGHNWEEKNIFKQYNLPYAEAILGSSLYPMLESKRFDYLSTSALDEFSSAPTSIIFSQEFLLGKDLKLKALNHNNLKTLDNFYIYHPIPVQMHISRSNPLLTKRLALGLRRINDSGEIQKLIKDVAKGATFEQSKKVKILALNNPLYSEEANAKQLKKLKSSLPKNIEFIAH